MPEHVFGPGEERNGSLDTGASAEAFRHHAENMQAEHVAGEGRREGRRWPFNRQGRAAREEAEDRARAARADRVVAAREAVETAVAAPDYATQQVDAEVRRIEAERKSLEAALARKAAHGAGRSHAPGAQEHTPAGQGPHPEAHGVDRAGTASGAHVGRAAVPGMMDPEGLFMPPPPPEADPPWEPTLGDKVGYAGFKIWDSTLGSHKDSDWNVTARGGKKRKNPFRPEEHNATQAHVPEPHSAAPQYWDYQARAWVESGRTTVHVDPVDAAQGALQAGMMSAGLIPPSPSRLGGGHNGPGVEHHPAPSQHSPAPPERPPASPDRHEVKRAEREAQRLERERQKAEKAALDAQKRAQRAEIEATHKREAEARRAAEVGANVATGVLTREPAVLAGGDDEASQQRWDALAEVAGAPRHDFGDKIADSLEQRGRGIKSRAAELVQRALPATHDGGKPLPPVSVRVAKRVGHALSSLNPWGGDSGGGGDNAPASEAANPTRAAETNAMGEPAPDWMTATGAIPWPERVSIPVERFKNLNSDGDFSREFERIEREHPDRPDIRLANLIVLQHRVVDVAARDHRELNIEVTAGKNGERLVVPMAKHVQLAIQRAKVASDAYIREQN